MSAWLLLILVPLYFVLGILVAAFIYKQFDLQPSDSYGNNKDGGILLAAAFWPVCIAGAIIVFVGWFLVFGFLRSIRSTAKLFGASNLQS